MSDILALITTPIAGANPMGDNINYDLDFDALKAEVGKLGGIDLDVVEEKSRTLLQNKSKDLRVMCFFAYALLREDKWEGLADVFDGMAQLAAQNFDAMFPDRPRARQLGIKWLSEDRFKDVLTAEKKPAEADYAHIKRLLDALTALRPILEEKFPEGSPFPAELHKHVQAWEKATKPKPVEATPASSTSPGATGAATADPMDTPKQAQTIARKPALFLCEKEPTKPMGFRLMRSIRWDGIEALPPVQDGKTQLPGPNPQQRTYLDGLLAQKDWKTLHEKAEGAFAGGANHFWLDLQRFSATGCAELGAPYAAVRTAILTELALLLKRLPGLTALSYTDGTPFCDGITKTWIDTEVSPTLAGGSAAASVPAGDAMADERKQIDTLVASNQIEKALALVQVSIRNSASEEDNFRRSILLGSLLLKAKQPDIALSIYESLDERIAQYHLDKWNPDLATEAWSGLIATIKVAKAQKPQNTQVTLTDKHNTILRKISQIDPMKAFELNK